MPRIPRIAPQEQKPYTLFVFPTIYDKINTDMNIPLDKIYEFHKLRTSCHIASVNYFADLVGYHFPEHDNDKNIEPIRTGYAYKNYASYHFEYKMPDNYSELYELAHTIHHMHAPHHIEFYAGDATKISDTCLIEMICDWFSANFEQVNILNDYEYKSVSDWFNAKMSNYNWTPVQLKIIHDVIEKLQRESDSNNLMRIWSTIKS